MFSQEVKRVCMCVCTHVFCMYVCVFVCTWIHAHVGVQRSGQELKPVRVGISVINLFDSGWRWWRRVNCRANEHQVLMMGLHREGWLWLSFTAGGWTKLMTWTSACKPPVFAFLAGSGRTVWWKGCTSQAASRLEMKAEEEAHWAAWDVAVQGQRRQNRGHW